MALCRSTQWPDEEAAYRRMKRPWNMAFFWVRVKIHNLLWRLWMFLFCRSADRLHLKYKKERAKKPMPTELDAEELRLLDMMARHDPAAIPPDRYGKKEGLA